MPKTPQVLLVEDEDDLREIICFAVESQLDVQAIEASSGNRAIEILKGEPDVAMVISDMRMRDGDGTAVFQYLQEKHPEIPFLACTADSPELHREVSGPPLIGYLQKPFQMRALIDHIRNVVGEHQKAQGQERKYCRIRSSLVLKADLMACNLYIKLSDTKFVKLLSSGEALTDDDVQRFEQKSVDFFYIPAEEAPQLLERLTRDVRRFGKLIARIPISASVQDLIVIERSTLEVIHELGQTMGFTEELSELTWASVDLALQAISRTPSIRDIFQTRMCKKGSYITGHSVILAHLACGIAHLIPDLDTEESRNALTLAAFLHDLALEDESLARARVISDLQRLSLSSQPSIVSRVREHPIQAAEYARRISGANSKVAGLIEQHHERPDGTGFPKGLSAAELPALGVVFNLAEDLVDGVMCPDENSIETPNALLARMIRTYPPGVFRDLAVQVSKLIQPSP